MGKFEDSLPKTVAELEKTLGSKNREISNIWADADHDCDCEFCTYEPDPMTPDEEKYVANLEAEADDITSIIKKLKRHAFANGVEIKEKK